MPEAKKTNRLASEKSPYLLQHAYNPVDWYPWSDEAFEKAEKENKPVFLSIGYSTCHWCHVMAHESFEDSGIAELLNNDFVSIKVDREERPDIDMLYMRVCQIMTGSGGWPLTVIMTPDKRPFFAATYIPKETRFGHPGLTELLPLVRQAWLEQKERLVDASRQVIEALKQVTPGPGGLLKKPVLDVAFEQLQAAYDEEYGGFGRAPKFPTPHNLFFLLRYWKRSGKGKALEMVEKTLTAMRAGGIYDQLGFGFHRYSTDRSWLVPHFEKMLYDQALAAIAYLEAFQATGKEEYAGTAREIFDYVLRDMTAPEGGFYSGEDADSEGREGKYYLWPFGELADILSPEELRLITAIFKVRKDGNFAGETGETGGDNILHIDGSLEDSAREFGLSRSEMDVLLESVRRKLLAQREMRVRPHKDDKVLTDWNGLMIAALAKGAAVLDDNRYRAAAAGAASFILDNMLAENGSLLHRYRDGEAALAGTLDDYAFLIFGLVELYEQSFEAHYLKSALNMTAYLMEHFWDRKDGGFFFTADNAEKIFVRQKEIYDGALPSGNSVSMLNLLRLARITADPVFEKNASRIGKAFSGDVINTPANYTALLLALDFASGPSCEVIVVGRPEAENTRGMLRAITREFVPNKVVILVPVEQEADIVRIAPFLRNYSAIEGRATAYVCVNYKCELPTVSPGEAVKMLLNSSYQRDSV